jgi:hypothetical protein
MADESTSDQFFDHRQFEAYRRLGQYQMDAALTSVEWALATRTAEAAQPAMGGTAAAHADTTAPARAASEAGADVVAQPAADASAGRRQRARTPRGRGSP